MSRLAATLLFTLLAPLAYADAPDWTVDASAYGTSMTITAAVDLSHTTAGPGDVLGVYARDAASGLDVWRGVGEATALNSTTVRFLLTVYGDTEGETLYLRYYDASADEVYRTDHSFTYEANRVFGTIAAPVFIDRFMRESGTPSWTIDPAAFGLSMTVTARVVVDGVTATVQDRLAAFSGGTLRGVATPAQVGQDALFFLTVYAANASETVDFRLYDASADTVYAIRELLMFQANSRQGSATAPLDLVARTQDLRPTLALFPADGDEAVSAEVTLRWRPDPAATAYRVHVATDAAFTDLLHDVEVIQPEHALPLLDYATTYHWRVQSVAGVDIGPWAAFHFATIAFATTQAVAPVDGATRASAQTTLRWRPDPAATAYRVHVATDAAFTNLIHDAEVTQPEHALPLLDYATTYHWRVQSVAGVDVGPWSTFHFATIAFATTQAVAPADGSAATSAQVTLQWTPDPAATAYRVHVATDAAFTDLLHDAEVTQPEYALPRLDYATTYHWRVQSLVGVDAGPWSTFHFATATGVHSEAGAPSERFALHPNHPNPFTQGTQIRYTLAEPALAVVTVHDLLGREVARIQDGIQAAGTHLARFYAHDHPSGLYLYRLQAGTQVATRTMTLIK